jgi:putrescine aminotransferase
MFAFQSEGVTPDVLVLGKALGGGLVPVSAALVGARLHEKAYGTIDRFDLHSTTYGGGGLACAAALATLDLIEEERLVDNAAARGRQLRDGLERALAGHPLVRAVRGRGLLVGIELGPAGAGGIFEKITAPFAAAMAKNVFGQWLALRLLERGILCQPASLRWDVLKLEPPLTVSAEHIDRAVAEVGAVLAEYRDLAPLLKDVVARLGRQLLAGWQF